MSAEDRFFENRFPDAPPEGWAADVPALTTLACSLGDAVIRLTFSSGAVTCEDCFVYTGNLRVCLGAFQWVWAAHYCVK
jgi:hypothetical protein